MSNTKTVPFNYEQFKASVDAGKPFQLVDSCEVPNKVDFVGLANNTKNGIQICGVHNGEPSFWFSNGGYFKKFTYVNDLQMQVPDEPEKSELDEFADWLFKTVMENHTNTQPINSGKELVEMFKLERAGK